MKRITQYQTRDGIKHDTIDQALRHADRIYSDKICELARDLVALGQYQAVKAFIDANLRRFIEANDLKNDMILENPDDDED